MASITAIFDSAQRRGVKAELRRLRERASRALEPRDLMAIRAEFSRVAKAVDVAPEENLHVLESMLARAAERFGL